MPPKIIKRDPWTPIVGYDESIMKADFASKAGLFKKLSEPPYLELVDQRIQNLFKRSSEGTIIPFLEMIKVSPTKDKGAMRQVLIERGTVVHEYLQNLLNSGVENAVKVHFK
jgi:hypothetical protein